MGANEAAQMERPARLLVADDHELVRAGMRGMLAGEAGLEVVGEAATGREALTLCRRLRPDLALLDMRMPELDGLATTCRLREECPQTRVMIVTFYPSPDCLVEVLRAGATGYILKGASQTELLVAIHRVLRGEVVLHTEVATASLCRLADAHHREARLPVEHLTPREHQVVQLLAAGHTNRAIAVRLGVSAGTVKVHVEHIIGKLQAADRTQAAIRAMQLGLINADVGSPA